MHPPSRCACFVVKASHNAHCMVDPPTWVGVTHGGAGSGGRCRFRPTFNLVRENVMCSCGTLVGFGVWLISTLVSTKSGVWLLTVRGKGAIMSGLTHVSTGGKAPAHPRGFSIKTILAGGVGSRNADDTGWNLVSEDPKVTHVVRPVLATMHGQGGTRGGTVLSDAVHAVNPGRSWSGDPCSSRQ
ncbi:hypothetical protein VNO80_31916 [Phaseolus coccineus]|uniref:Uncharacterized protein n=2 Tax=Phaseolus coccineus TaxID=3886 RepID=A0AAN9L0L7_PHACN